MNCKKCGSELERGWKYCPMCGDKKSIFKVFQRRELTPEEEMTKAMRKAEGMLKMMGFPMKINFKFNTPETESIEMPMGVKQKRIQAPVQKTKIKEEAPRKVKETLEPITKVTKTAKGTKYVLVIPGVMSPKDINIRQFEESIEIRAYTKDKAFFKVIPTGPDSQIIEKRYQDEMLKLIVS